MFGVEKKKRKRKKTSYEGTKIQNFSDLSIGDYVVHEEHGLGIYRGIEKNRAGWSHQGLFKGRICGQRELISSCDKA